MKFYTIFSKTLAVIVAVTTFLLPIQVLTTPVHAAGVRYLDAIFSDFVVTKDIPYGAGQLLDLYEPKGDTEPNRAVIILIHGGGFVAGSKEGWDGVAKKLAQRGYVAMAINYRLSDPNTTPNTFSNSFPYEPIKKAKDDTFAAIRWARANAQKYRLSDSMIATIGSSAGAVTSLYAAYDTADVGSSGNPGFSSKIKAAVSYAGGMRASDLGTINPGDPPSAIFHGLDDGIVPPATSKQVDAKLTELGISHEAYYYAGVQHNVSGQADVMPKTLAFLMKYVINSTTPTTPPVTTTVPPTTIPPTTVPPTTSVPPSTTTPPVTTTNPPATKTPSVTHTPSETGFAEDPLLYLGGLLYAAGVIAFVSARILGTKKLK